MLRAMSDTSCIVRFNVNSRYQLSSPIGPDQSTVTEVITPEMNNEPSMYNLTDGANTIEPLYSGKVLASQNLISLLA